MQAQGSHYPRNSELLKLYGPVMTYFSEVAKALRSQKPKPSSSFGVQTLSQLSHAILVFPSICPYQKFRTMLVISSHKVFGILKTLIVYMGID